MDIGQRILEAVLRSESTGTIVKDLKDLHVSCYKYPNIEKYDIRFFNKKAVVGFEFNTDTDDKEDIVYTINHCLNVLGYPVSKVLGEMS